MLVFDAHDTATPGLPQPLVLVEIRVEDLGKSVEVDLILTADIGQCNAGSGFLVYELAQVGLAAYEAVWHALLAAEGWEEYNHFDRIDVVGHHNKLGSAILDEVGNVVKAKLKEDGLRASLGVLRLSSGF